jgi:DNA-binding NtrC family response regulator
MTAVASMARDPVTYADGTAPLAAAGKPPPLGAVVRFEGAQARPPVLRLGAGPSVVGSAPNCDVVVADKAVSRQHLELELVADGVRVRDLGSRNGTFFQGQRVERMTVGLGARLSLGSATLVLDADRSELDHAPVLEEDNYRGIVGVSPAMRRMFGAMQRLEGSLVTVLVEGESGVGKERVALALHEGSRVADGPFLPINCGAIPRELVASELFGHRRGAFSGALDARRGAFEAADGGTLFLDEIGELPLEMQPMLLRALELGEVRSLGDDAARRVSVRVVAATNRDLEADVRVGRFRHDLFYRLAVVRLAVPPLRERPEDVAPLARLFAAGAGLSDLPEAVVAELAHRSWPGNVRELKNAVTGYAALGALPQARSRAPGELERLVGELVDPDRPLAEQKEDLVDAFTRSYLRTVLARAAGNQSEAARRAGLNRSYMLRLLAKYGLGRER